jgi:hypothetical protein
MPATSLCHRINSSQGIRNVRCLAYAQFLECLCRIALQVIPHSTKPTPRQRLKALLQSFSAVLHRPSVERILKLRVHSSGTKDGLIKAAAAFHGRCAPADVMWLQLCDPVFIAASLFSLRIAVNK